MTASVLDRIEGFVTRNGRALDVSRFRHAVRGGAVQDVVDALAAFQNADGGFGNGLESDLQLPDSSPIATWVGLGLLIDLGVDAQAGIVRRAIDYLQTSYDADAGRWLPVSPSVNDYPHGGWWHYAEDKGGTVIHQTPWNPTAALAGYLWHYGVSGEPSPAELMDRGLAYMRDRSDTDLEWHELGTFVQLAVLAPEPRAQELRSLTTSAVLRVVARKREDWEGYGPQPLAFISDPGDFLCADLAELVDANLDYWLDTLGDDGAWPLTYHWGRDEAEFERLRPELTASFAVHRAIVLRAFGRLEE